MSERKHSKFSPSSAYIWLRCPYSVVLSDMVDGVLSSESKASRTGHELHEQAEKILKGEDVADSHYKVEEYCNYVQGLREKNVLQECIEQKLDMSHLISGMFGTVDFLIWCKVKDKIVLHVVDFKSGDVEVTAKENTQLMLYALGALEVRHADYIKLHIVQEDNTNAWWADPTLLNDLIIKLGRVQSGVVTQELHFGAHCRYCKAAAICPIINEKIKIFVDAASGTYEKVEHFEELLLVENILSTIAKRARERIIFEYYHNNYKPTYFFIKQRKGKITWLDDAKEKLKQHVMADKLFEYVLVPAAKAREILSDVEIHKYVKEPQTLSTLVTKR